MALGLVHHTHCVPQGNGWFKVIARSDHAGESVVTSSFVTLLNLIWRFVRMNGLGEPVDAVAILARIEAKISEEGACRSTWVYR